MPYELFIAFRYLLAKRKQVMVSVITVIAISAVALGVAALIVVLAMMTGFREEFQTRILSGTAHLNLMRSDGRPIMSYDQLGETVGRLPHIRSASATLYHRVLIQGSQGSDGAVLKGIDMRLPPSENEVFQFTAEGDPNSLRAAETDPETGIPIDRIILGRELARAVGLRIGDIATVISPRGHLTPLGLAPRARDFAVSGLFESGLSDYDATWAYISLEAAQRLAGSEDVAELIQIKVDDVDAVKRIKREVLAAVGDEYVAEDWQELNAPIYTALSYEKLLSAVALIIVIAIASLNIITILTMIVMEKQKDIAILKSMGATNRGIMSVFVLVGLIIGVAGMITGAALGSGFCYIADSGRWIKLPAGAYALDYLPFHTSPLDVALVAVSTVIISLASTVYPSLSAARLDPVEGLRYE